MTEQEKIEFERRKKDAENQLNKMYYGASGNTQNNKGLKMPPFLNSPQQKTNDNHTNNKNNNAQKPPPKEQGAQKETTKRKSGIDLLNLLNFKEIKMDNDRLIILALCLLLSSDDIDELLLLALMYIMF